MTRKEYRIVDTRTGEPSWVFRTLREALADLAEARTGYPWPDDLVIEQRPVAKWERRK